MRAFHVRRGIWLFAGFCVALALIWPAFDVWNAWRSPVLAHIVMIPDHPVAGKPFYISVVLSGDAAHVAGEAPLVLVMDMVGMSMGQRTIAIAASQTPRYDAPLRFSMPGHWWVDLHLTLPSHAPWQQRVIIAVQPEGS